MSRAHLHYDAISHLCVEDDCAAMLAMQAKRRYVTRIHAGVFAGTVFFTVIAFVLMGWNGAIPALLLWPMSPLVAHYLCSDHAVDGADFF